MKVDIDAELQFLRAKPLEEHELQREMQRPLRRFLANTKEGSNWLADDLQFEHKKVKISDIRQSHTAFTLENHGFQIVQYPTKLSPDSFSNKANVDSNYTPEIESLLRSIYPDADLIFIFDWKLRSSAAPPRAMPPIGKNDTVEWTRPAQRVHVDQSPETVHSRIQLRFGHRADLVLRGRIRIINAWRPLEHEVFDYPLAVCDGTSVSQDDLVPFDRKFTPGQALMARFNEGQRWHYMSRQKPDEVLLMKQFDSDTTISAKCCPHTAFRDPNCGPNPLPRKSIEMRALVLNFPPGLRTLQQNLGRQFHNTNPGRFSNPNQGRFNGQNQGQLNNVNQRQFDNPNLGRFVNPNQGQFNGRNQEQFNNPDQRQLNIQNLGRFGGPNRGWLRNLNQGQFNNAYQG